MNLNDRPSMQGFDAISLIARGDQSRGLKQDGAMPAQSSYGAVEPAGRTPAPDGFGTNSKLPSDCSVRCLIWA